MKSDNNRQENYTIQEFSRRCGISADRLRHYEKMGLIHPARDAQNSYRYYTDDHLLDVQMISYFQSLRIPLKDMGLGAHRCSPQAVETLLVERIAGLQSEIEALQIQLHMLEMIQQRIPEMTADYCTPRSWQIAARSLLYYDRCAEAPDGARAMETWMRHFPYVASAFTIPPDAPAHGGTLVIRPCLELLDRLASQIGMERIEWAERFEEMPGIRFAIAMRNPLHPTAEDFRPALDFMAQINSRPAGPWLCGVRGTDEDEQGPIYYVRIMVPVAHVSST